MNLDVPFSTDRKADPTAAQPPLAPSSSPSAPVATGSTAKTIAYMLARGNFPEEIQAATGLSPVAIRLAINDSKIRALVAEIIAEEKDFDPRVLFRSYLTQAVQALGEIVMSSAARPGDRISAAKEIISRNLGNIPIGIEQKAKKDPVAEYNELKRLQQSTSLR